MPTPPVFALRPGDVLLYRGRGLYGTLIMVKTWHPVGHVEVYVGQGNSVASRDGVGVGQYPLRQEDMNHILRPVLPFDLPAAMKWFEGAKGQPYGWLDLLQFVGLGVNAKGVVCSPFATQFVRAGGVPLFGPEPAEKIAPMEFLLSEFLYEVWPSPEELPIVPPTSYPR